MEQPRIRRLAAALAARAVRQAQDAFELGDDVPDDLLALSEQDQIRLCRELGRLADQHERAAQMEEK
jgi:hypothetical protein